MQHIHVNSWCVFRVACQNVYLNISTWRIDSRLEQFPISPTQRLSWHVRYHVSRKSLVQRRSKSLPRLTTFMSSDTGTSAQPITAHKYITYVKLVVGTSLMSYIFYIILSLAHTPHLRIFYSWSKHKRIRTVRQDSGRMAHPRGLYYNGKEGRWVRAMCWQKSDSCLTMCRLTPFSV